jgi:hypothetical protein
MEQPPGSGNFVRQNVHGAGAQRSDPKAGNPSATEWENGHGPQGDEVRIYHYVRCVREGAHAPTNDTDADGLSDWYEYDYTTNIIAMAADGDMDGDGFPNIDECGAGTSPLDEASLLAVTGVSVTSGMAVVTWTSVYGKRYGLERSTNLLTDGFSQVVGSGIDGALSLNVYTDTTASAASSAQYRIRVE